jgi:integrase
MDAVTRTATLFVRHDSKDCRCKDKDKENDWQKCKCVKTMLLYDGAKPEGHRQWKQSTRRRVWEEAEYAAILGQVQKDGDTKLETFLELLRWSGMALVDATLFDTKSVVNGTLDYKRQKTGKRAIVVLPSRVVALLNKLPDGQPFRRPDFKLESDKAFWRIQLQNLFERAKVTEVKTDLGMRPAHPHQLRDTCGVVHPQGRVDPGRRQDAGRYRGDGRAPLPSVHRRTKGRARRDEQTDSGSGRR